MKTASHGIYYRKALCTVQITRETSTNLTRFFALFALHVTRYLHFIKPVVTGFSYSEKPVFNARALILLQVILVVFFQKSLKVG